MKRSATHYTTALAVGLAVLLSTRTAGASYIDQLQNQSPAWVGNPTRTAATDGVDAIMYNPAGTARLQEGLTTQVGLQLIAFPNRVTVEDPTYPGQRDYSTSTPGVYVPNLYLAYKNGSWTGFLGASIIGGGGSLYWPNGLPNSNGALELVDTNPAMGWQSGAHYWGTSAPSVNIAQRSQMPSLTLGAAYALDERISLSLGGRVVYGDQGMTMKVAQSGVGFAGDATLYDASWTATGYTGVIGVDAQVVPGLNLAATFETLTVLNYQVDVKTDASKTSLAYGGKQALSAMLGYVDGRHFRFDMPAKLSLGAEYSPVASLKVSLSGIVYFPQWGSYERPATSTLLTGAENTDHLDLRTAYEVGVGFDWHLLSHVSWTGGVNYSCMNLRSSQLNEGLIKNDLVDLGTGLHVSASDSLSFTIAYMHNIYTEKSNRTQTEVATTGTFYKTQYHESADDVAVGLEYRFF